MYVSKAMLTSTYASVLTLDNPLPDAFRRLVFSAGGEAFLSVLENLRVEVEWA
ncbi:MAG: hypothetical protein ACUVX9_16035 [Anaerolineae bacterium]